MGLPVVSHRVAIMACADFLRPLDQDADANPLKDEILRLARENPELAQVVIWFSTGCFDKIQSLIVAAFVCKVLRAQAEVDELEASVR